MWMLYGPDIADENLSILELKKKRAFRKFSYRGIDLDQYV